MSTPFLQVETKTGEPILAGDFTLIPFARSLRIHPPGLPGGLIWNRPLAVAVQAGDGLERRLPVRDVTRQAQLAQLVAGLAGSLLIWLTFRRKSHG